MSIESIQQTENLIASLKKALLSPLKKELTLHKKYIDATENLYQSYVKRINRIESQNSIGKYINETNWLKEELYDQLNTEFPSRETVSVGTYFADYLLELNEFLQSIPELEKVEQTKERFHLQKDDGLKMRFYKPLKNLTYHITKLPIYAANAVSKTKRPIKYWNHSVPLRQMNEHYFGSEMINQFLPKLRELAELKCRARSVRWQINKNINTEVSGLLEKDEVNFELLMEHLKEMSEKDELQQILQVFVAKQKEWQKFITELFDKQLAAIEKAKLQVDTIELSAGNYSAATIQSEYQKVANLFQNIINGWRNTEYAQIDDFQTDLELFQIKYNALMQFYLLQGSCRSRINKSIAENLGKLKTP